MITLGALNDSTRSSRCTYLFAGVWYDGDPLWSFLALLTFLLPQLKQLKLMFAHVRRCSTQACGWRPGETETTSSVHHGCSETTTEDSTGASPVQIPQTPQPSTIPPMSRDVGEGLQRPSVTPSPLLPFSVTYVPQAPLNCQNVKTSSCAECVAD